MSKWKYKSLEWIHKVRAENYKKTKDMSHKEIIKQTKKECEKMKKIFAILFVGLIAATGIVYLSGNEKNKNENMDVHAYVEKNKEQILQQGRSGSVEPMGGWAKRKEMPTARYMLAVGVVNNKIYAIGGITLGHLLNTTEEYDPATNNWTTKAPMPTARHRLAIGVVNNKIYAIGSLELLIAH